MPSHLAGPPRCHRSTINATQPGRQLASIPFVALLPKPTFVGNPVLQLYSSWTSGPHVACSSMTWGSEHYYQPLVVSNPECCNDAEHDVLLTRPRALFVPSANLSKYLVLLYSFHSVQYSTVQYSTIIVVLNSINSTLVVLYCGSVAILSKI